MLLKPLMFKSFLNSTSILCLAFVGMTSLPAHASTKENEAPRTRSCQNSLVAQFEAQIEAQRLSALPASARLKLLRTKQAISDVFPSTEEQRPHILPVALPPVKQESSAAAEAKSADGLSSKDKLEKPLSDPSASKPRRLSLPLPQNKPVKKDSDPNDVDYIEGLKRVMALFESGKVAPESDETETLQELLTLEERTKGLLPIPEEAQEKTQDYWAKAYCNYAEILWSLDKHAKAIQHYEQSAELGFLSARCALGNIYLEGDTGFSADRQKALFHFQQAADKGHKKAKELVRILKD